MAQIDIEYVDDSMWRWIPSTWRITEILADGPKRLVTEAKVSNDSINSPVEIHPTR